MGISEFPVVFSPDTTLDPLLFYAGSPTMPRVAMISAERGKASILILALVKSTQMSNNLDELFSKHNSWCSVTRLRYAAIE